jgi:hypothetical protein
MTALLREAPIREPWRARGHGAADARVIEVRVTAEARPLYLDWGGAAVMPNGTLIIATEVSPKPPNRQLAMLKQRSRWRFFELDGAGSSVAEDASGRCQRCHDEARADSVFGPPAAHAR